MGRTWSVVDWSDATIDRIKGLVLNDGLSASQVARKLCGELPGITRNEVIGKLHRLGIVGGSGQKNGNGRANSRPQLPRVPCLRAALVPRIAAVRTVSRIGKGVRLRSEKRARLVERKEASPPDSPWIPIWELGSGARHWPKGDPTDIEEFRYCGAAVEPDHSYCPFHCSLAYVGTAEKYAKGVERNQWLMRA